MTDIRKQLLIDEILTKKINGIPEARINELCETDFQDAECYEIRIILSYVPCYVYEFETLFNLEL